MAVVETSARETTGFATERVEVPEWGMAIHVRGLTRDEVRNLPDTPGEQDVAVWAAGCVSPSFTVEQAQVIVNTKAFAPTQRVLTRILELSGLGPAFHRERVVALARGEIDTFEFYLAEKLHRTVAELGEMPEREYREWAAYEQLKAERARHASRLGRR